MKSRISPKSARPSPNLLPSGAEGLAGLPNLPNRGGASPEKVGWKKDRMDGQKVYLTIFMPFLLRNEYRPEESGVYMSTPVHPVSPPLLPNLPFSELVSQSNTNSESSKSTVFRIGTNQTHP